MVKLDDLGEVNRGRSRHRPRYAPHLYGGPYPFIQTADIKASNGKILNYSQTYSEAGLSQSRLWPAGTMCITIAANIAETGILQFPACFPDSIIGFIGNPEKCDTRFIEYMFRYLKRYIHHEASDSGTVQDNINLDYLKKMFFPIPIDTAEQRTIARTLGALDDKIEHNRRMNRTLEEMARAIFKSWFVDFDPVAAKAEGRQPYGMSVEMAALFPAEFVDTTDDNFLVIPKGWEEGKVGDIGENIRRTVTPSQVNSDMPYIGLEHMPRRNITLSEWGNAEDVTSNKFLFKKGEILFGKLRPYFHKVGVSSIDGICSTDILVLNSKNPEYFGILLGHLSSVDFINYVDAGSEGTRMPRTNWEMMERYTIVIPDKRTADCFTNIVNPIVKKIRANIAEFHLLADVRDVLLPRLLSGEVCVKGGN